MRLALAALALAACSPPEVGTAQKVLGCLASGDIRCLRQYHAPQISRFAAWSHALRLDALRVGPYTRRALQDADNPYWTLHPRPCAEAAAEQRLPAEALRALSACRCRTLGKVRLAPAEDRRRALDPARQAAAKTHPAMDVLASRAVAEAVRTTEIARVDCRCGERTIALAMLDLQGRVPPWRYFRVSGVCGPPDAGAVEDAMRRAERFLGGELSAANSPSR
jgi:hypothetical protein